MISTLSNLALYSVFAWLFLFTGSAQALTIEATMTDFDSYPATVNGVSGGGIGTFELATDISGTGLEDILDDEFLAMCLEPDEFVSTGTTYIFETVDLADAPTSIPGGMGETNADWIEALLAFWGVESVEAMVDALTADQLSLTQGIVYEAANETTGVFNLDAGTAVVTDVSVDAGATAAAASGDTEDWLLETVALLNVGVSGGAGSSLYAAQDFFVFQAMPVREPGVALLLGFGLGLLVLVGKQDSA